MSIAISRRKTALALVKEITEGVAVKPSSANDFSALQEGFSMQPAFEVLSNAELKASIGKAKDELGSENPTASFSHYIKASGVEGQEPDYKVLLEAAFGAKIVVATQNLTEASSTISALKYDETVALVRGQAVLVKDGVNGYSIRNIANAVGDTLTLAQNLVGAPAAGVGLGKPVTYKVADENHPTFSLWYYLGNGGAVELMAGARVTELSISAVAGQYINGSFSIGGVSYSFNPIVIGATDTKLDFLDEAIDRVATVAAKSYKDPHELAAAIAASMNALGSANVFTVAYSNSTGKFTITSNGAIFSLKWSTGANTANTIGDKIGFVVASDDTGSITYLADNAQDFSAPYTPAYDDTSAIVAKENEVMLGSASDITCFKAQECSIKLANTKTDIPDLCEASGKSGSLITQREVTANVKFLLSKYDADKFRRFRTGESTIFTFNFGVKEGGQWVAGKCCNVHLPTCSITSFEIQDNNGLCIVDIALSAFVDDGQAELFLNFL